MSSVRKEGARQDFLLGKYVLEAWLTRATFGIPYEKAAAAAQKEAQKLAKRLEEYDVKPEDIFQAGSGYDKERLLRSTKELKKIKLISAVTNKLSETREKKR